MKGPQGQRTRPLVHRRNLINQTKWHGPDRMIISEKALVFVEPVGSDSKVAELIKASRQ